ncbi:hypothetical protein C8Q80DRAFT_1119490 [Daedaleopsis nitida]|nr:hypothetical protein C8Q80DRAFT_1119490 [Daedaleopsis nitida]
MPKIKKQEDEDTKPLYWNTSERDERKSPFNLPLVKSSLQTDAATELKDRKPKRREPSVLPSSLDTRSLGLDVVKVDDEHDNPIQVEPDLQPRVVSPSTEGNIRVIVRGGRALPFVEVVLPRLEDVRRRQRSQLEKASTQAQSWTDRVAEAGLPDMQLGAGADAGSPPGHVLVKLEPEEDQKPLLADPMDPVDLDAAHVSRRLRKAVEDMRNPDVKVKKELLLSDEFLLDALTWEGISHRYPIPVSREVAEYGFARAYISSVYGGNTQATCPHPSKKMLARHGLDDWMFLTLDFNPHAPTKPGCSGLFFCWGRAEDDWHNVMRTFVRTKASRWVYMGQYQMKPGKSLTTDTWKQQKEVVRRTWAQAFFAKGWGTDLIVRLGLQKDHGEDYKPTQEDYDNADVERYRNMITENDVLRAFDDGEEEIGTFRMICIDYEAEFVRTLAQNAASWVPPRKKKRVAGPVSQETTRAKKRTRTGPKTT